MEKVKLVSNIELEFDLSSLSPDVLGRYGYAREIAPEILEIHSGIKQVVLFGSVAEFKAGPTSDIDVAVIHRLSIPYNSQEHQALLNNYRGFKGGLVDTPFRVHLIILPEEDIRKADYSVSKNIAEKGIILCSR